jgi:hypothetical protein
LRKRSDVICFAYRQGYGLFPVRSIDFEKHEVYDYDNKKHNLGSMCEIVLGNKTTSANEQKKG